MLLNTKLVEFTTSRRKGKTSRAASCSQAACGPPLGAEVLECVMSVSLLRKERTRTAAF